MAEVVITGLGPVAPNGVGKESFWNALKEGKSGIRRISRFDPDGSISRIAGEVPPEWVEAISPFPGTKRAWSTHMVITAAHLAMDDAGISKAEFSKSLSGIYVGISTNDMEFGEREYETFKHSGSTKANVISSSFPHAAASEIAGEFKCAGRVMTVSTACSSGILSIISGAESILRGENDLVLAGGGDAPLTPFVVSCFSSAGLHPTSYNDSPLMASRPFDAKRDGGVLSEGAGMIVIENSERARLRGAKVYARISGWGVANATSPLSVTLSFVSSITQALQKAKLPLNMLDYICAHAPGIKFTDKVETEAIKNVFGQYAYNLPVSSIKSMIGNPLSAAGPLQVITTALVIQNKFIPPTVNYEHPDPACDLDYVPNRGRVARVRNALINLLGVGGCIVSMVITEP
ncbi:MAG: beta-ketoacyl-[acyl-carrier-protein] synthase family protein [Dethiobacter sp.]|jgi:3-oxoacyl-[acyl-carrier-protein] synthase II|nr:MAG: beta-ketoacyl-[acyl-carrier-protein] synthase family protein [Dethiobacter sp.]